MKTKIIVASVVAILVVVAISCGIFGSSDPQPEPFNIQGKWTIDSIENKGPDSSKNKGNLILAFASKDSLPVGVQFNNDSTFQYLNASDSIKGKYYLSEDKNSLFVKEDSVIHQFSFIEKSDSAFSFASVDSTIYHLRRE